MANDGFIRGEILTVSIPDEQHSSKKVQRRRNVFKSQQITHALVLSRESDGTYLVAACKDIPTKKTVQYQVGQTCYYVSFTQVFPIDDDVLKRAFGLITPDTEKVLNAIEEKRAAHLKKNERKQKPSHRVLVVFAEKNMETTALRNFTCRNIQYNASNVVCPECIKLIPTTDSYVYIEGQGMPQLRVGYCAECNSFYSASPKVYDKNGELLGRPVCYSYLRYRDGKGNKIRFRTIYHRKTVVSEKAITQTQRESSPKLLKDKPKNAKKEMAVPYPLLLKQLPIVGERDRKCPICNHTPDGMQWVEYLTYDGLGKQTKAAEYGRYCASCDVVFFDAGQEREIRRRAKESRIFTIDAFKYTSGSDLMKAASQEPRKNLRYSDSVRLPYEFEEASRPNLSSEQKAVFIYAKKCHCRACLNKYGVNTLKNRTAVVKTIDKRNVEVNVMFCMGCGRYYMNYSSFEEYRKKYGGLLFEYKFTGELLDRDSHFLNMASDSILSRCGYTVQAGVSKEYRQAVLSYILESQKATKSQIIELITNFIALRDYNPVFENACARWREDLLFVNQHRIGEQRKVYGLKFEQGKK